MKGRMKQKIGLNKAAINGVKTKVILQHYLWPLVQRPNGAKPTLCCLPLILKDPKQVCSIYPNVEKFKSLEEKITMRNVTNSCLGQ